MADTDLFIHASDIQDFVQQILYKDRQIAEKDAEIARLNAIGLPCSGCGMIYPGNPSCEPWACDKCLDREDGRDATTDGASRP